MSFRTKPLKPLKRKGYWYLNRRVPRIYRALESRDVVLISTGIRISDDPFGVSARQAIAELDGALIGRWQRAASAGSVDPAERYEAAVAAVQVRGLGYQHISEVAELPVKELIERIGTIGDPTTEPDSVLGAVLGTVERPQIRLSELRQNCEEIVSVSLKNKSPRQLKRWRTTRDRAVEIFTEVLEGDKTIAELTRKDVLKLRSHYQTRILKNEIEIDTANKNIGYVASMFRAVDEANMMELPNIFDKSSIRGAKKQQRIPYHAEYVQDCLLADGVFADLNDEARHLIYVLAETGLRPSEACNLAKDTIKLDHDVPHVQVRPDGREMKTDQSEREIPLVGVALMAMRMHPNGFPRYRERANELSALVNKALRIRKLRPNGETLYSLRHTFKDRLRNAGVEDELKDTLMGHMLRGPKYGFGYSLKTKLDALMKIAFRPPSYI